MSGVVRVAFCRSLDMDAETVRQAGIGGLLHDVGKAIVPDEILNKPERLTDPEFEVVKGHPADGHAMLTQISPVGAVPLDIVLNHHERIDGSGYPGKKPAGEISRLAQMAAIVDVYDALTSDRQYYRAISPADVIRKIYGWSDTRFDRGLVQDFIRCVGIYPIGTLVLLQSGRLAVVAETNDADMLRPKVHAFYSTKSSVYIKPQCVDLSDSLGAGAGERILSHESPDKWHINPLRFLALSD